MRSHVDPTAVKEVIRCMENVNLQRNDKLNNGHCGDGTEDPTFTQVMNLHCAADVFRLRKEYCDDRVRGSLVRYIKGEQQDGCGSHKIGKGESAMRLTYDDFVTAMDGERSNDRIAKMMKEEVVWCEMKQLIDAGELQETDAWCAAHGLEQEMADLRGELAAKQPQRAGESGEAI